jgi:hypothetical protein
MNLTPPVTIISSAILIGIGYLLGSRPGSNQVLTSDAAIPVLTSSAAPSSVQVTANPGNYRQAKVLEGLSDEQITEAASAALKEPDPMLRQHRWTGVLAEMTKENRQAISKAIKARYASGVDTDGVGGLSQFREGQVQGVEGMDAMPQEPNGVPANPTRLKFQGWASVNPAEALEWLQKLGPGKGRTTMEDQWRKGLERATSSVQAEIFPKLQPSEQRLLIKGIINGLLDSGGMAQARDWFQDVAATGDPLVAKSAFSTMVSRMSQSGLTPETTAFIEAEAPKLGNGSEVLPALCHNIGYYNPGGCVELLQRLSVSCPDVAQNLDSLLAQTVKESSTTSLNTMGNWLNQNPNHPLHDQTLVHFVNQCQADDPEAATRWANTIKDETLRAATLQRLQAQ